MTYQMNQGPVTLSATTGLTQHRFVTLGASDLAYPSAGGRITGVLISSGTTGSTSTVDISAAVQTVGIAKVSAPASTVSKGDFIAASSVGQAVPTSAGDYVVGQVVEGSSGGAGRLLSVLISPVGTT